jgi:hypothetical protein
VAHGMAINTWPKSEYRGETKTQDFLVNSVDSTPRVDNGRELMESNWTLSKVIRALYRVCF